MKKTRFLPVILLLSLIALLFGCVFGLSNGRKAYADDYYDDAAYTFYFENYDVTYDIAKNRKISVTEKIQVHFTGYASTGFIKDIPANGGELVRNVKVYKLDTFESSERKSVLYKVKIDDNKFVSVDIGDYTKKSGQSHTFLITYDYCLTKAQEGKNALSLNPIGVARDCVIENAGITLILPDGFIDADCKSGSSNHNSESLEYEKTVTDDGRTALRMENLTLGKNEGVTVDMSFEGGSLSKYSDFTPYWFVIVGAVLVAVVILLKLFVFNKDSLMPVVNYEAPDKMDPLLMGKLIDNKIDNEDITSLIYYWANKGYLKINLDDKNNPVLIRVVQKLPDGTPVYEQTLFYGLFAGRETVKPSQLKNKFYTTVQQAKTQVTAKTKGLYSVPSIAAAVAFAVAGALIMGLAPLILAMTGISLSLIYFPSLFVAVPVFVIYVLEICLFLSRLKLTKNKIILFSALLLAAGALLVLFYTLFIPSSIIPVAAKILISVTGCAVFGTSAILICRTKQYTDKLNDILGFKNFILLAEKHQLETMIEDDPQFYFNVLPYAQVLGVTKVWEDKFADITVEPPKWVTGDVMTTVIEFHILNSIINSSLRNVTSSMVSNPSSSGLGGHGGFGGGSIGGGHGGGGFRGR